MASWLLGFSASWLLGFLASRLLASGFLLVYGAFGGFLALASRILCIPSSAGGILAFAAFRWFQLRFQELKRTFGAAILPKFGVVFWLSQNLKGDWNVS